jgi:hypothetical protein
MRQRAKDLPERISQANRAGAEAVLRDWLDVMPVDTSEAISNTQIGIVERPVVIRPPFFRGRKGSTRSESAERALTIGLEALSAKQPGQTIFTSNTARHIGELDRGSSMQFAGGFLPRGLLVFKQAVKASIERSSK